MYSFARRERGYHEAFTRSRNLIGEQMLDSGTWSLTQNPSKYGRTVTLPNYISYLSNVSNRPQQIINFDDDFSKDGFATNLRNQQILESAGFSPIPVIHDCYNHQEVNHYIDNEYKYIAIGSGEILYAKMFDLEMIVKKFYRAGIKVHFLGSMDFSRIACLPVYSSDSSSWTQVGGKGGIKYWRPEKPGFDKTDNVYFDSYYSLPKIKRKNHYELYRYRQELEDYLDLELDMTVEDLTGAKRFFCRRVVNLHYFVQLEKRIRDEHRRRGFSF
jgi:hypothetical protein